MTTFYTDTALGQQAIASHNAATLDRTKKNKHRQAEYYLTFCLTYATNILTPSTLDACIFVQFLANSLRAARARGNYLSGARTWIRERGGDPSALSDPMVKAVETGAVRLSATAPSPAPALLPADLVTVCRAFSALPEGPLLTAAVTIGFFGFLRTSNLLSPAATLWGGPHTLQRRDIQLYAGGLLVVLRSTKTSGPDQQPTVLALPRLPGSPACPTTAWVRYAASSRGGPGDPAFLLGNGSPLATDALVGTLRLVLRNAGCPYADRVSSHSLRRGGAQAAQASGATLEALKAHGTWRTDSAMGRYLLPKATESVARALATLFGN